MIDHGHELSSACVTVLEKDDESHETQTRLRHQTRPGTGRSDTVPSTSTSVPVYCTVWNGGICLQEQRYSVYNCNIDGN
jgi:hypothetical protein